MARFIVFEGIDGSGTTTQSQLLSESDLDLYFWDKEPTDGDIGLLIRQILKDKKDVSPVTLLQLFLADRVEHQKVIFAEIEKGKSVVLDRYILSTMAYQGLYFDKDTLYHLSENFIRPDLIFFMDINPSDALKRKEGGKELFEELDILTKVRNHYLESVEYLKEKGWNIFTLDASKPKEVLFDEVQKLLKESL